MLSYSFRLIRGLDPTADGPCTQGSTETLSEYRWGSASTTQIDVIFGVKVKGGVSTVGQKLRQLAPNVFHHESSKFK